MNLNPAAQAERHRRVLRPDKWIAMVVFSHAKLIFNEREVQLRGFLGYSWRYPVGTEDPNTSFL
jgi:hypothetical protein